MRLGLGLSICQPQAPAGAPTFDPATLALTGWWRASFTASPWVGEASAGTSGSHNLTGGTPPSVGSAVSGKAPAVFNGSTQRLAGAAMNAFVSAAAGTFFGVIKPVSVVSDNVVPYGNPGIWQDSTNGYFGAGISDAGFRPFVFDSGAGQYKQRTIACSASAYHFVAMRWDSSNLKAWVDGTTDSVACGATVSDPNALTVGTEYTTTIFANFEALELGFSDTALSDADIANLKSYANARYGLSL